jgi:hypothetical protein
MHVTPTHRLVSHPILTSLSSVKEYLQFTWQINVLNWLHSTLPTVILYTLATKEYSIHYTLSIISY